MAKGLRIPENTIYVCGGSKCKKRGSKEVRKFLDKLADKSELDIRVLKTSCTDNCKYGPIVCFQPQNAWFDYVDEDKAKKIFEEMFLTHSSGEANPASGFSGEEESKV